MPQKRSTPHTCSGCGTAFLIDAYRLRGPGAKFCTRECLRATQPARAVQRFWSNVQKGDGCWEWTGYRLPTGYGIFSRCYPVQVLAHRFSWEIHNGPIPEGMYICHHCDFPPCVRPDHLFLGTSQDNYRDMRAKNRDRGYFKTTPPQGQANPIAKLTEDDVRAIRLRYDADGISQTVLAREYGVLQSTISKVVLRVSWRHIE